MTKIDQDFELPEDQTPIVGPTISPENTKSSHWKKLLIAIPALTFLVLVLTIVVVSSDSKDDTSTTITPAPTPSVPAESTPQREEINRLIEQKAALEKLDIDQKDIQPPVLDLNVKF